MTILTPSAAEVVAEVLRNDCGVTSEIEPDSLLAEDLGLDSVGMLSLALGLENHYRLVLGEDPENPPRTVAELVQLVERRLQEEAR